MDFILKETFHESIMIRVILDSTNMQKSNVNPECFQFAATKKEKAFNVFYS